MNHINVSIVLYQTPKDTVLRAIESCISSELVLKLYLIDNSPDNSLEELGRIDKRIIYIFNNTNLGYGKAHNIAIRKSIDEGINYHLVLNPDVYFEKGVLEKLHSFMEENQDIGLIMPKILYPDGSVQYLCKLLPTPLDLFIRRFLNCSYFKKWMKKRNEVYELRFTDYNNLMDVPYLSGCFMFLRVQVLKKAGLFDERFFLYCDDLDLSRRIHQISRTVYYPYCHVFHDWGRGSYHSYRLLLHHIRDAIKYFNKWGWFRDPQRKRINKEILFKFPMAK